MPRYVDLTDAPASANAKGMVSDHLEAPGPYLFEIIELREGVSGGGNEQYILELEVAEGPYAGSSMYDFFPFYKPGGSKRGMQRFHHFLDALGAKVTDPRNLYIDEKKFVGRKIGGYVKDRLPKEERPDDPITSQIERYATAKDVQEGPEPPVVATAPAARTNGAKASTPKAAPKPARVADELELEPAPPTGNGDRQTEEPPITAIADDIESFFDDD